MFEMTVTKKCTLKHCSAADFHGMSIMTDQSPHRVPLNGSTISKKIGKRPTSHDDRYEGWGSRNDGSFNDTHTNNWGDGSSSKKQRTQPGQTGGYGSAIGSPGRIVSRPKRKKLRWPCPTKIISTRSSTKVAARKAEEEVTNWAFLDQVATASHQPHRLTLLPKALPCPLGADCSRWRRRIKKRVVMDRVDKLLSSLTTKVSMQGDARMMPWRGNRDRHCGARTSKISMRLIRNITRVVVVLVVVMVVDYHPPAMAAQ